LWLLWIALKIDYVGMGLDANPGIFFLIL
jgi:hypothetical protein